ncbi:MAG TPA: ComEA family DNA-binding protein [Anaerolineae bacterium]|nr:ComEA family DNA-binding protein [Anaerolineae bacterium]HQH38746.1 ComEA family DNA-binding protein [Anaerolineae bacterium]
MDVGLPPAVDLDAALVEVRHQVRMQYRVYVIVVALVSLVVGGLIVWFTLREEASRANVLLTPPPYWGQMCVSTASAVKAAPVFTATPPAWHVYISGAVVHPGVVAVPEGSLLADALNAAGGTTADADLENINLAVPLADNQHITVPRLVATATPQPVAVATVAPSTVRVNINTATAAELETLPHIGPTMAQRIIAYREANGPFQRLEDLQKVEGIGETRFKDIAPLITVE